MSCPLSSRACGSEMPAATVPPIYRNTGENPTFSQSNGTTSEFLDGHCLAILMRPATTRTRHAWSLCSSAPTLVILTLLQQLTSCCFETRQQQTDARLGSRSTTIMPCSRSSQSLLEQKSSIQPDTDTVPTRGSNHHGGIPK